MIKTKLKIRTLGDPCLRKKAAPVKKIGVAERLLIESMLYTISEKETDIGLAATQVGIGKQIFVVALPDFPHVFVDPKVVKTEGPEEVMEEGCLSLPGLIFKVSRPQKIGIDYTNENNEKCHLECEDFHARVILHENDHLNGKMIIDHADQSEIEKQKDAIAKLEIDTKKALKRK
ncbi:MAG: peptide deformylase [Candidatus Omnitrophica bacterium]|nr:peptide deformylase [Candidatus Omnitrophota bacterium]